MSKGSRRRPMQVGREEFDRNWEAAFSKDEGGRMKDESTPHTPCAVPSAEQPDPVCGCGRTTSGVCRRCGQTMKGTA